MVYRRPNDLVCYWRAGHVLLHRFETGQVAGAGAGAIELLRHLDDWRTPTECVRAHADRPAAWVRAVLGRLASAGLLEVRRTRPRRSAPPSGWAGWNPAAGFFHFSTRDVHTPADDADIAIAENWKRLTTRPRPPLFKRTGGTPTPLPPPRTDGDLPDILRARRTWRRFGRTPVSLADLSTLLALTFGVQHLAVNAQGHRFALRTSPSGGALQSIEAYVIARAVRGLDAGVYHYQPVDHTLARIGGPAPKRTITRYVAGQWWFESASALVAMSAMFSRAQWKYQSPRAYRTVLTEAGHFCQTWCLVAAWLGLAPFCTQAFADSSIEADLGIDGRDESLVYLAGVGTRPPNADAGSLQAGHVPDRRSSSP